MEDWHEKDGPTPIGFRIETALVVALVAVGYLSLGILVIGWLIDFLA